MKNKLSHIVFLITLTALSACEKDVLVDIKEAKKQLVVNGLFNQMVPFQTNITESISPYDEKINLRDLTRSEVALYENDVFIEFMSYHKEAEEITGNYYSTLTPTPGNKYRIEITDPVYGRVTAISGIPSQATILNTKSNWTPWGEDTLNVIRFNFEFELDDPPEENYYYLTIGCPLLKPDPTTGDYKIFDFQYAEIYSADIASPQTYLKNGLLFKDANFNGTKYTISGTATMYIFPCCEYESDVIIDKKKLFVFLENLSEEAHNFHTSYAQRLNTQNDLYAEPGPVYSNINNGIGIFGGSNLTETRIPIMY